MTQRPIMLTKKKNKRTCDACGTKQGRGVPLMICSVCCAVGYCNDVCQKNHWASHKAGCTETASICLLEAIQGDDFDTIKRLARHKRVVYGRVKVLKHEDHGHCQEEWTTPLHTSVVRKNVKALEILVDGVREQTRI